MKSCKAVSILREKIVNDFRIIEVATETVDDGCDFDATLRVEVKRREPSMTKGTAIRVVVDDEVRDLWSFSFDEATEMAEEKPQKLANILFD